MLSDCCPFLQELFQIPYQISPADPCNGQQAHNSFFQALICMIPVGRENHQANQTRDLGLTLKPQILICDTVLPAEKLMGHSLELLMLS